MDKTSHLLGSKVLMAPRGREETTLDSVPPMVARGKEETTLDSVAPMVARGREVKAMDSRVMEARGKVALAALEARDKAAPVAMTDGANVQIIHYIYKFSIRFALRLFGDSVFSLHQPKVVEGLDVTRETAQMEEATEAEGVAAMTLVVMTAAGGVLLVWGKLMLYCCLQSNGQ